MLETSNCPNFHCIHHDLFLKCEPLTAFIQVLIPNLSFIRTKRGWLGRAIYLVPTITFLPRVRTILLGSGMSSHNHARPTGIESLAGALVLENLYIILSAWFIRKYFTHPTSGVYRVLSLFCAGKWTLIIFQKFRPFSGLSVFSTSRRVYHTYHHCGLGICCKDVWTSHGRRDSFRYWLCLAFLLSLRHVLGSVGSLVRTLRD